MPGMMPPGVATLLVGAGGTPGVTVGTAMVAVGEGKPGVTVGAITGVSVGRTTAVGKGVGLPTSEREQDASRNVRVMLSITRVSFFMARSF
jgi:hypothetical protein